MQIGTLFSCGEQKSTSDHAHNTQNAEAHNLQQQKTTSVCTPNSQEMESKATVHTDTL